MFTEGDRPSKLSAFIKESNSGAIVTSYLKNETPAQNQAALVEADQISSVYAKRKLFGGEVNMVTPGNKAVAVPFSGTQVGLNICFDSCFPSIMGQTASLPGVGLIALPTIDPPSTHHFVAKMHSAFTPFRAAELGLPIIRADGYAYSQIVDSIGTIIAEAEPGVTSLVADITPGRRWTLYSLIGNGWFAFYFGLIAFYWVRRWKEPKAEKPRAHGL